MFVVALRNKDDTSYFGLALKSLQRNVHAGTMRPAVGVTEGEQR